jgi:hypothetical protein
MMNTTRLDNMSDSSSNCRRAEEQGVQQLEHLQQHSACLAWQLQKH